MAKLTIEEKGMAQVLAALNKVNPNTATGVIKGFLAAGLLVQRRAQKKTPVEFGLLRASAFTRKAQDSSLGVEVGYGAKYALFVHEKTAEKLRGKRRRSGLGTYWNPGESKFLSKAFQESRQEIYDLVVKFITADLKSKS